jgi:hypothetical protein
MTHQSLIIILVLPFQGITTLNLMLETNIWFCFLQLSVLCQILNYYLREMINNQNTLTKRVSSF